MSGREDTNLFLGLFVFFNQIIPNISTKGIFIGRTSLCIFPSFLLRFFFFCLSSVKTVLVNKVNQMEFPSQKAPWWKVPGKCTGQLSGCSVPTVVGCDASWWCCAWAILVCLCKAGYPSHVSFIKNEVYSWKFRWLEGKLTSRVVIQGVMETWVGGERGRHIHNSVLHGKLCWRGKECWASVAGDEVGGDRCDTFCSLVSVSEFLVLGKQVISLEGISLSSGQVIT